MDQLQEHQKFKNSKTLKNERRQIGGRKMNQMSKYRYIASIHVSLD